MKIKKLLIIYANKGRWFNPMSKFVYISADYAPNDGDKDVIAELNKWRRDNLHKIEFYDTAQVASGSVSKNKNCRPCDLKAEFNRQINKSSAVIFIVGDKTKDRTAGSSCKRNTDGKYCSCTPYKENANGTSICKKLYTPKFDKDVEIINEYSYLEHEFRQAVKKKENKSIIIVYNSLNYQSNWLPVYMRDYEDRAHPFWKKDTLNHKVGNYQYIKKALGYE